MSEGINLTAPEWLAVAVGSGVAWIQVIPRTDKC